MIFLVDKKNDVVQGPFDDIQGYPMEGAFPVFVPFNDFRFDASLGNSSTDLFFQKYNRYAVEAAKYMTPSGSGVYEEFVVTPSFNPSYSQFYQTGDIRRFILEPATTPILNGVVAVGSIPTGYEFFSSPTNIYFNYSAYSVNISNGLLPWGSPTYSAYTSFVPSDITVNLIDNTGTLLQTLSVGNNIASIGGYTGGFYIQFQNNSNLRVTLADLYIAWD